MVYLQVWYPSRVILRVRLGECYSGAFIGDPMWGSYLRVATPLVFQS